MVRSLAPWLWLLDFRATRKALDASDDPSGELSAALGEHFTEVHSLRANNARLEEFNTANEAQGWRPASVHAGTARDIKWPDGTFDCVALHDALTRSAHSERQVIQELDEYRRILRGDGWLVLASPTPRAAARGQAETPAIPRRRLTRLVEQSDFREVRCLWFEHMIERPLFLIPNSRRTIEAYEAMRGSASRQRRAAAKAGLNSLLYPAYFLLARA